MAPDRCAILVAHERYLPAEALLAALPPATADALRADLGLVQDQIGAGVIPSRDRADQRIWDVWCKFAASIGLDSYLSSLCDPVPILNVFAARVCRGELAHDGAPVRARTAEGYLRAVGQSYARVGSPDPRLNTYGKTDWRIGRQIRAWKKEDPPPGRVKPIPISMLHHLSQSGRDAGDAKSLLIGCMAYVAFYFLMRPGEYCNSSNELHPFLLCDV